MYPIVLRWTVITLQRLLLFLLLAGRVTLAGLHPRKQIRLAVTDGAADFGVGRPVAPHAGLGEKRVADAPQRGRFLRREEFAECRRRDLLRGTTMLD